MSMSQPFNNPTANPALVQMWRNNLAKSRQVIPPPPVLPTVIPINFDGVGQPLVVNMAGSTPVNFPCRLLAVRLFAGTAQLEPITVTATVDLRRGQVGSWAAGSHPLHSGTLPSLVAQCESSPSISGWDIELQPGDLILWRLVTFIGAATWLSVALEVRRLDVRGVGEAGVTDSTGDFVTDSTGARVVMRS